MNEQPERSADAVQRAAEIIAQALLEAEVIIGTEREARPQPLPPQLVDTLDRFSNVLGRLVEHTEQIAERLAELTDAIASISMASRPAGAAAGGVELRFPAGGEGVDVTIAAVPGFQELMELQRALVRIPQVQSAAVRSYKDDEAAVQVVLAQPMEGSAIAAAVSQATQHQIIVDESHPEALRLRLRFLDRGR